MFTDGSSCVDGCRAGIILTDPEGTDFSYALRFQFEATNNEAEYEALIAGLRIAEKMGVKNLQVNVDSKLVANQVNRTYVAKETDMIKYLEKQADALSKISSTSFAHLSKQVLVEELKEKSKRETEVLAVVEEEGDSWMTLIRKYLADEILPEEKKKVRAIKRNMHAGTRSVVAKALRTGYYWPIMHKDARELIRACQECQGIDIAAPFPEGPDKVKLLIVAMDYFIKWIEAKPEATIIGNQVKTFIWENIVCRFGLPGEIISDNGKQF
ncbi:reverse transcriptase domain-containing protein [Tanacetum coccineum]